jgi:hypothetical protein
MDNIEMKPLLVPGPTARKIIGVGTTKYWEMVRRGDIEIVRVGGRTMVIYASLEKLARPTPRAA